jgi:hypothetical protein
LRGWSCLASAASASPDYDGCELRFIAELSGEQSWIDAFNSGKDVHSMCAEIMYGQRWKDAADEGCAYYAKSAKCKCMKGYSCVENV